MRKFIQYFDIMFRIIHAFYVYLHPVFPMLTIMTFMYECFLGERMYDLWFHIQKQALFEYQSGEATIIPS